MELFQHLLHPTYDPWGEGFVSGNFEALTSYPVEKPTQGTPIAAQESGSNVLFEEVFSGTESVPYVGKSTCVWERVVISMEVLNGDM
jgi:hypothetical protein